MGEGGSLHRNFDLSDEPHPGRPSTNVSELERLRNRRLRSRCLLEQLLCSHTAIEYHVHGFIFTWN